MRPYHARRAERMTDVHGSCYVPQARLPSERRCQAYAGPVACDTMRRHEDRGITLGHGCDADDEAYRLTERTFICTRASFHLAPVGSVRSIDCEMPLVYSGCALVECRYHNASPDVYGERVAYWPAFVGFACLSGRLDLGLLFLWLLLWALMLGGRL